MTEALVLVLAAAVAAVLLRARQALARANALEAELRGQAAVRERELEERRRVERELRESRAQLDLTLDTVGMGVWALDLATGALAWDDEMHALFGAAPGDVGDHDGFLRLVHPDDRERVDARVRESVETGEGFEVQYRLASDPSCTIAARGRFQRDAAGRPERMTGLCWDVSERVRMEEALARAAEELRRSNHDLEQFAYVASHDLQEPLRMVASYVQLLERRYRGRLDADADRFIAYAVDGARRMQRMISDLLAYSRVGRAELEMEALDASELVDEALRGLGGAVAESHATVTRDELPRVRGSRAQLVQVLQNLFGNALKYHGAAPPRVHVGSAPAEPGRVTITVRDEGIGFDPEHARRIFEPFQRLHRRGEYPGTGIGLAIVKRIVDRHGGSIRVEARPGEGCTFHLTLPRPEKPEPGEEESVS